MNRRLSTDAAAFLSRIAAGPGFPGGEDPDELAGFLARERSRLGSAPDLRPLTTAERAVRAEDSGVGATVAFRAYESPDPAPEVRPTIVFVHGGGWVSGGLDQHDRTCRILAVAAGARVVSVDYRLAPENPYPVPLDDCEEVLAAVGAAAPESPLAVMGFSSGGTLAAALARRARERSAPRVALQVLVYPALDATLSSPAYEATENGSGYFVSTEQMAWYWQQYRGDGAADDDPEFSPLAAGDLAGLAPALIVTAEFDPLRDDGARYAERLADAGVPSVRLHFPGMIHGFLGLIDDFRDAGPALRALGAAVGEALRAVGEHGTMDPFAGWRTMPEGRAENGG